MRTIALDMHMVGTRETGNETYAASLATALAQLGGYQYRLYTPRPAALDAALRAAPGVSVGTFPEVPAAVRIPLIYPYLVRRDRAALLHMQYVCPPRTPCPVILTVHDVSFRVLPQFFSPWVRLLVGPLIGPSMRRAARVITDSEASRADIRRFYRLPADRVVAIPAAAGPQYRPQPDSEVARVRAAYGLPNRYILVVGNVQLRKNVTRLVTAFAAVAHARPDVHLVIVGQSAWRGSEVEAAVQTSGVGPRVHFTGYLPNADLPGIYAGAVVFCYPSLYEGFGLPPLEAMACGTATITSNVSSLPEVVGDGALTVDPTSVDAIAAALGTLLDDAGIRDRLRARGLAQAGRFSWERTAALTRDVYSGVLQSRRRARTTES